MKGDVSLDSNGLRLLDDFISASREMWGLLTWIIKTGNMFYMLDIFSMKQTLSGQMIL